MLTIQNEKVGILHPGQMGVSVAATLQNSGHSVYWASQGRSLQTHRRAEQFNLVDKVTLAALAQTCSLLVSVCPPAAAEALAEQVSAAGYRGMYLDANAISPQRVLSMGERMEKAGISFVDGGIIGGPAWKPGETWLYLSGPQAERASQYFHAGPLGTRVISPEIGKASALKMCFAAYTKGSRAMLCAVLGAAENLGVLDDLKTQWGMEFTHQALTGAVNVTAKAWRFTGEMEEIAATFREAGMPGGFHEAAADIYRRMEQFKGADPHPDFEEVLRALIQNKQ
jgi:3-hydroxyisobutyrate dehydrogenase-like beta-hydroxyacid dehydrogenase